MKALIELDDNGGIVEVEEVNNVEPKEFVVEYVTMLAELDGDDCVVETEEVTKVEPKESVVA